LQNQDPDEEKHFSREDVHYEVTHDSDLNVSAKDCDVDLSTLSEIEIDQFMTALTTEPVWDDMEMTDSNPLEPRTGDVDVSFGGRYDELLRKTGD
jgi:hypothetical protein